RSSLCSFTKEEAMNPARKITVGGVKGMILLLALAQASCALAPAPATHTSTETPQATKQQVLAAYGKLPFSLEPTAAQPAPTDAKVEYRDVYPGLNLVYYGNQRQLEHDFVVSPDADPTAITLGFEGVDGMAIDALGDLVLRADGSEVRLHKPFVYQNHDGRR